MIVSILTFLTLLLLSYMFSKINWKYQGFASPGLCLPLLGHSYKFTTKRFRSDPVNEIWRIYRKYQKEGIMYFKMFNQDTVWVGDFNIVKYIFNHSHGNGRFDEKMDDIGKKDRKVHGSQFPGIVFSVGETWKQQRRHALRTLRDFGFGKQGMEEMIQEEVKQFKIFLHEHSVEPFDIAHRLNLPILNALWKMTVGERFDYDDSRLLNLCQKSSECFKMFVSTKQAIIYNYPWVEKIPGASRVFDFQIMRRTLHQLVDLMQEAIVQHQQTLDPSAPRDYTDVVLAEIQNTTDPSSSFYGQVGLDNLKVALFDLFLAGSETTSTTLTWAALYMVRYPEVQARVQQELARVVGEDRSPAMEHRPRLPYTEAVIMEVQRHANIVPFGIRHMTEVELEVRGHLLPAGTVVMPVMAEVMKGEHWGDGEVFRPERFLSASGQLRRDEHFIPFSTGKRQCLGEALARTELFLFFTALVQSFTFLPEKAGEMPAEEWQLGLTSLPTPFKLRLKPRVG